MRKLILFFCLSVFAKAAVVAAQTDQGSYDREECIEMKKNNIELGLIYDAFYRAGGGAEAIVTHLTMNYGNYNQEFLGFHFGSVQSSIAAVSSILTRAYQYGPLKVLKAEGDSLGRIFKFERRDRWYQAISCYRFLCEKPDKYQLIDAMKDLIAATKALSDSDSVKRCYLRAQ